MRRSAPFRFGSLRARPPHAEPGQRIGLLGGSFNPPHAAHRLISEIALKRLGLDRVWWLVTPGNPLKGRSELRPLEERVAAARAMVRDPRIIVTAFEKDLGSTFTAATLAYLKLRRPGVHFVWLMGADCLASLHRWQHWRQMLDLMPVAVIDRPGWRHKGLASRAGRACAAWRRPEEAGRRLAGMAPPSWMLLSGPMLALSSTELRAQQRQASAAGQGDGSRGQPHGERTAATTP